MARNYVAIPYDYKREMAALDDAEFGRLCRALIDYSENGTPISLCGNERFYAERVMMQEDRYQESYDDLRQSRSEGGKKGMSNRWRNKGNSVINVDNSVMTSRNSDNSVINGITGDNKNNKIETETKIETEIDTLLSSDNKSRVRARFTPPSVDDVATYCRERRNGVDPQRFVDFYASKGWKVGNQVMRDWKAAVRTWESRDGPKKPTGEVYPLGVDMAAAMAENRRAYERIVNG